MMWWWHDGVAWPWMLGGFLWMVVFWGAIIGVIVWGISRLTRRGEGPGSDSALEIARRRYARGEISREEFEQLKQDLSR